VNVGRLGLRQSISDAATFLVSGIAGLQLEVAGRLEAAPRREELGCGSYTDELVGRQLRAWSEKK